MSGRRWMWLIGVATLALVGTLGGCSPYSAPVLTVKDVKVVQETEEGLALAITLSARNDNEVALPLRAAEYRLELAEGEDPARLKPVFEGTRSPEASIRRKGEQEIVLPVVVKLRDHLGGGAGEPVTRPMGVHAFRLWTRLTYITPGALAEVMFDTGVRRPVVSITQNGRIDFGEGTGAGVKLVAGEDSGDQHR